MIMEHVPFVDPLHILSGNVKTGSPNQNWHGWRNVTTAAGIMGHLEADCYKRKMGISKKQADTPRVSSTGPGNEN